MKAPPFLAKKLGLREGQRIAVINSPPGYIERLGKQVESIGRTIQENAPRIWFNTSAWGEMS